MTEIIMLKLGELVLKGLNRSSFETKLLTNLRRRIKSCGDFQVRSAQSTVYIEPLNDDSDMDAAYIAAKHVFGAMTVTKAAVCPKELNAIFETASQYLEEELNRAKTFKVESKRSDKRFPLGSIELSQKIGGRLHDAFSHLSVDVKKPDLTVHLEIRDTAAYIHAPAQAGAGGLPCGTGGKAAVLLSGGIDSPVAAYMAAKRGLELEAVHFFSYPYTSERAKEKVFELAKLLCGYTGRMPVNVVPFTEIQEKIRDKCPEPLFTLIMRRFMMEIAERLAIKNGCGALITGESLGQVASQTLESLAVTNQVCTLPVLRPVIGMDKEEIITISRKIETFETSILPYEDCCTVFTPKHPKTKPRLEELLEAEKALDRASLIESAVEATERVRITL